MSSIATIAVLLGSLFGNITENVDLVDQHYFLAFSPAKPAHGALAEVPACKKRNNWKTVPKSEMLGDLAGALQKGIDIGYSGTPEYRQQMSDLRKTLKRVSDQLGTSVVTVCEHHDAPPYSDGHNWVFVGVDGKLAFMYEVGRPD
jgi:hypothetical protein